MVKHRKASSLFLLSAIVFLSACKKNVSDDLQANLTTASQPAAAPASAQVMQTSYAAAQSNYLWNRNLPGSYNFSAVTDPSALMTSIRQYSTEAGFAAPVDRWSFAMKQDEWNQLSGGMSTVFSSTSSTAGDFGLSVFFLAEGDLRVRMVEPASPAGAAGIKRGWRVAKINGSTAITTANAQTIINNIYYSTAAAITFQKPDGTLTDINLNAGHYNTKPVYLDTVYNTAAGKTGYLVYSSFLGDMNQAKSEYARVFSKFSAAGISNLVVDLRYNGGGYVDLQEELADYIVNSSAGGAVMMKQIYNEDHSADNSTSYFVKKGNVNLSKVYFIVSSSTASASELLINNLKPYMDVRLIGPTNTHGKPVGFFPIAAGDWYVFPVSFKTVNKNNEGNYYSGFAPNARVADGLDKDWGDVSESCLASALRNISSGSYRSAGEPVYNELPVISKGNTILDKDFLKITVASKK